MYVGCCQESRVSGYVAFWFGYASFRPDGELYGW